MSDDIYPTIRGLTFTVRRTPEFSTIVQGSPNFIETRIIQAEMPRWHWELKYNYIKNDAGNLMVGYDYTDFDRFLAFFLDHYGQGDDFLFEDDQTPDNYVGPAVIGSPLAPNEDAELPLVQDSGTSVWYSPLQRRLADTWVEDIADLNGAVDIYDNAVLKVQNTDYHVHGPGLAIPGYSYAGMYIEWLITPTGPITAEFNYYWRVRYESDMTDLERFSNLLWGGGGDLGGSPIRLQTSRRYL